MKRQVFHILLLIPVFTACLESPEMTKGIINGKEKPTVVSCQTEIPAAGSLLFQGEIVSKGKSEIIGRGFYWGTDSVNLNMKLVSDLTTDVFSCELENVRGGKTYYWRTFAENSFGCDSGEVQAFQTPGIWVEKDSLNGDSRWRGAVFTLYNRVYVTCGNRDFGGPVSETWEYNITSDRWVHSERVSFPGGGRRYPVAFTIGNFAYVGTGLEANMLAHKDFYRLSAEYREWTTIATPPNDFEERHEAVAFGIDGKGYIIGGLSANGGELMDVWQYDPENDSWQQKGDFPVPLHRGTGISGNNRIFAGFGNANESSGKLWEYIKDEDRWDEFTELPDDAKTNKIYSGVIIQNTIYVIDRNNRIWTCNLSNKIWKEKTRLPSVFENQVPDDVYQNLLTTGNSNSIYVGLGFTKQFYEYCPLWDN